MKKYAYRIDVWSCGRLIASHRICADSEEKAIEYFEACSRWGGHNPLFTLTIGRKENLLMGNRFVGWQNIVDDGHGNRVGSCIWKTREEAENNKPLHCVSTIKIYWEEDYED